METSYLGFVKCSPSSFDQFFHDSFHRSFAGLDENQYFQYDITQPAGLGTKLATTLVSRCLVGEAGTTYKYLGIRMFSYPWNVDAVGSTNHTIRIGKLNKQLIKRTEELLRNSEKKCVGSCQYNLTLINRYQIIMLYVFI